VGFYQNKLILNSRVNVNSSFRFLPKSVVNGSIEYGDTRFDQGPTITPGNLTLAQNQNSRGMNASLGLNSVLSRKITYNLNAGYAYLGFEDGSAAHSVIGQASLRYSPSSRLASGLGYTRGVRVSTFTNYYREHLLEADISYKAMQRLEVYMRQRLSFIDYSGPNVTLAGVARSDVIYQGLLGAAYRWTQWITSALDYTGILRDSNALTGQTPTQTASFLKHVVTLRLDLYY